MGYKGIGTKLSINKAEFTNEIILSKEKGELTRKAVDFFVKLANHAIRALPYTDPRDREDCIQFALLDMLLYWKNFDPKVSDNAFAYFTGMAYHGYAKGFKKIHKAGTPEFISLDHRGDAEIYSM